MQWNAVSHAAKNGYSHLSEVVKELKAIYVVGTHLSGMERMSAACMCGQSCSRYEFWVFTHHRWYLLCFGHVSVRGGVAAAADLRSTTLFE